MIEWDHSNLLVTTCSFESNWIRLAHNHPSTTRNIWRENRKRSDALWLHGSISSEGYTFGINIKIFTNNIKYKSQITFIKEKPLPDAPAARTPVTTNAPLDELKSQSNGSFGAILVLIFVLFKSLPNPGV